MKQSFERLAHTSKINVGNFLKILLNILFKQKKRLGCQIMPGFIKPANFLWL